MGLGRFSLELRDNGVHVLFEGGEPALVERGRLFLVVEFHHHFGPFLSSLGSGLHSLLFRLFQGSNALLNKSLTCLLPLLVPDAEATLSVAELLLGIYKGNLESIAIRLNFTLFGLALLEHLLLLF